MQQELQLCWGETLHTFCNDGMFVLPQNQVLHVALKGMGWVYGHGFNHHQPYPWNAGTISNSAFEVNNIQSPVWMCSAGYILVACTSHSLSVYYNKQGSEQLEIGCAAAPVSFRVFSGVTLSIAHAKYMAEFAGRAPLPLPDFIGDSMFCTWTQYPRCLTQQRVLGFAQAVRDVGYPSRLLLIDDRWETNYGDHSFSSDFENPVAMVQQLHDMGFKVLLWLTPFMNVGSAGYGELLAKGWLVADAQNPAEAAHFRWWGGQAALPDLTNPNCKKWFINRLQTLLQTYGIDGFKIDGGDGKYQPAAHNALWHCYPGASGYLRLLLEAFEQVCPGCCESRTGWMEQNLNIVWRQGGKDSHWGLDNGLHALLTLGLNLSLLGYRFFIPDMVGGRMQTMSPQDPLPTDELFVRFAECSALMPGLQFSYFPWNYAPAVNAACLAWARLHKDIAWYVEELLHSGHILLRPLWYNNENAPNAQQLYTENTAYMLGPDLVAAPVVHEGVAQRRVELPPGNWVCAYTHTLYQGGTQHTVPAPCPGMPVFVRQSNPRLLQNVCTALAALARGSIASGVCTATHQAGIQRDLDVTG